MKMEKAMRGSAILTIAVLLFVFVGQAGAYCVHNNSDTSMYVVQQSNASFWAPFQANLGPGNSACCPWSTKDCNESGGQTDPVGLTASLGSSKNYACENFQIPANGDMTVCGGNGNYRCVNGTSCN